MLFSLSKSLNSFFSSLLISCETWCSLGSSKGASTFVGPVISSHQAGIWKDDRILDFFKKKVVYMGAVNYIL